MDLNELQKRGLLIRREMEYALFSPTIQQWISYELSATPGPQENPYSMEKWLRDTGDEHLNPVKGVLPRFKKKFWPAVGNVVKEMSIELIGAVDMILAGMR